MRTLLPVLLATAVLGAVAAHTPSPSQEPQRPVFRSGTSLVRVDAYPSKDGRIVEGLTAADFEVLEDGVPQQIESFQFVEYARHTPAGARRDPNSQREGFQLAADPAYRVFVIYLDNLHVDFGGSHNTRMPLITFLNRVLGPQDLFGVLTTAQSPNDLMLGQRTEVIEEQLTRYWDWGSGGRGGADEADLVIAACFRNAETRVVEELVRRRRLDEVFTDLEGLMSLLANLREERKNILLVSNGWALPAPAPWAELGAPRRMPGIGVTDAGKLTMGSRRENAIDPRICEEQLQRLTGLDFQKRLRDLMSQARESNVTFYAIKASGLAAVDDRAQVSSLQTLTHETGGLAVVNTNDLTRGAMQIGDDLSAAYILGYYPSNIRADGRVRRITVRLKSSGETVRARREYRAPTEAELASMRAVAGAPVTSAPAVSPVDEALAELDRLRPGAVLHTRASIDNDALVVTTELTAPEVEAGRWKTGADIQVVVAGAGSELLASARGQLALGARSAVIRVPVPGSSGPFHVTIRLRSDDEGRAEDGVTVTRTTGLLGAPGLQRFATPNQPRPAGSVYFRRTERLRVRWPLAAPAESVSARLLGRDGKPLDLPVPVRTVDASGARDLVVDLNLAPLTAGEYVIEAAATAGGRTESARLAIRVTR